MRKFDNLCYEDFFEVYSLGPKGGLEWIRVVSMDISQPERYLRRMADDLVSHNQCGNRVGLVAFDRHGAELAYESLRDE